MVRCASCRSEFALACQCRKQSERPDNLAWLLGRGEDAVSLRALVEAVDAAQERHLGPETAPTGERRWSDTRAKFVDELSADLIEQETKYEELHETLAKLERASAEDVPVGGLSHDRAHFLLSGIRTAADALDVAGCWPDDARIVGRYLRELLK